MRRRDLLYLAGMLVVVLGFLASPSNSWAAYGDYISTISTGSLNQPAKVAVDQSGGDVYVTDAGNKLVKKFNYAGTYQSSFSVSGTPVGIAVTATNIFVGDDTNDCVWIYNKSGVLADLSGTGTSHKLGGAAGVALKMPNTVTLAPSGHIFVVDGDSDKIYIYNADGSANSNFGISNSITSSGTNIYVYYPTGLAMANSTGSGTVTQYFYLGDQGNFRVQKLHYSYDSTTKAITLAPTFDQNIGLGKGDNFNYFQRISDVAWDANLSRLIVVDSLQQVAQYDPTTPLTMTAAFNYASGVLGYLNIPTGAAIDAVNQKLYIANNQGASIAAFTTQDGQSPCLTVDNPASPVTLSLAGDNPYSIGYHVNDPDSTATLYLFYDTDTTWSTGSKSLTPGTGEGLIASTSVVQGACPPATTGSYNWQVISMNPGTYHVRGVAVDAKGNSTEVYSGSTVTITGTPGGLNDIFKATYGVTLPSDDPDNDGLTNLQEQTIGTNPIVSDTDGGGVSDGVEVAKGTNPLSSGDDYNSAFDMGVGFFHDGSATEIYISYFTMSNTTNQKVVADLTFYSYFGPLIGTDKVVFNPHETKRFRPRSLPSVAAYAVGNTPMGGAIIRTNVPHSIVGQYIEHAPHSSGMTYLDFAMDAPMLTTANTTLYTPWFIDNEGGFWTYLNLNNPGSTTATGTIYWYDMFSNLQNSSPFTLAAHQVMAWRPSDLQPATKGCVKIVASAPIFGHIERYAERVGSVPLYFDFAQSEQFCADGGNLSYYVPGYDDNYDRYLSWVTTMNIDPAVTTSMNINLYPIAGGTATNTTDSRIPLYGGSGRNQYNSNAKELGAEYGGPAQGSAAISITGGKVAAYSDGLRMNLADGNIFDSSWSYVPMKAPIGVGYFPYWADNLACSDFTGTYRTTFEINNPYDSPINVDLYLTSMNGQTTESYTNISVGARQTKRIRPSTYTSMTQGSVKVVANGGVGIVGKVIIDIISATDPVNLIDDTLATEWLVP